MHFRQILRYGSASNIRQAFDAGVAGCAGALFNLRQDRAAGRPYLCLPDTMTDLDAILRRAETLNAEGFTDFVVLGTGGSSLGAKALLALQGPTIVHKPPRVHVPDNLGAALMHAVLKQLDLTKTHFIAVSKSGGTAETIAQLISAYQAISALVGSDHASLHFTIITEPGDSAFRRLAQQWNLKTYDHDPNLGGRFSVLSIVGLLPAALAGLDCGALRQGALSVLDQALTSDNPAQVPAVAGAAFAHVLNVKGCNMQVLMAYDDRLAFFARWWAQLWAESLGKGGLGTTPVPALGPVDQHSQVQLYLDGPEDKLFTILAPVTAGSGPSIDPSHAGAAGADYLAGKTIGDLVDAEAAATAEALIRRGRPVRQISIDRLDETVLGALLMHFMLETVLAAHLSGVDAFDQPAVEEGKILTREALRDGRLPEPEPATVLNSLPV